MYYIFSMSKNNRLKPLSTPCTTKGSNICVLGKTQSAFCRALYILPRWCTLGERQLLCEEFRGKVFQLGCWAAQMLQAVARQAAKGHKKCWRALIIFPQLFLNPHLLAFLRYCHSNNCKGNQSRRLEGKRETDKLKVKRNSLVQTAFKLLFSATF